MRTIGTRFSVPIFAVYYIRGAYRPWVIVKATRRGCTSIAHYFTAGEARREATTMNERDR